MGNTAAKLSKQDKAEPADRLQWQAAADSFVASLQNKVKELQDDEVGADTLIAAFRVVCPVSDKSSEHVLAAFNTAAKHVGDSAEIFLKVLKNARIKGDTRRKIAKNIGDYKDLLKMTSDALQELRIHTKHAKENFDDLSALLLPDIDEDFTSLEDDKEKQKKIREWAEINAVHAQAPLILLQAAMNNKTPQESLKTLGLKWKEMEENLQAVMDQVKVDVREVRSKMSTMIGAAAFLGAALMAVALVCSGGTLCPIVAAAVGDSTAYAIGGTVGLALTGVAGFAFSLVAAPEVLDIVQEAQEKTIKHINEYLAEITLHAGELETMLHTIYKDRVELANALPIDPSMTSSTALRPAAKLASSLKESRDSLEALLRDIKDTEDVVKKELDAYNERINKPLLDLYK